MGLENIVLIYSNIKREIISNIKDKKSPASDVLAALAGGNIIGVNREPTRPINKTKVRYSKSELRMHKARVFNPQDYYYIKVMETDFDPLTKKALLEKSNNIAYNTVTLIKELTIQTEILKDTGSVKDYVARKDMVLEYNNGELIRLLFENPRVTSKPIRLDELF